jgi:hypothetical protein
MKAGLWSMMVSSSTPQWQRISSNMNALIVLQSTSGASSVPAMTIVSNGLRQYSDIWRHVHNVGMSFLE